MTTDEGRPCARQGDRTAGEDTDALRFVQAFAEGWRAPKSADALADHFEPWLEPDYSFTQPLLRTGETGPGAFRDAFARPVFTMLTDIRGTIEAWAHRDDHVFIALRLDADLGGRKVTVRACDRIRLVDGRAAERTTYTDPLPLIWAVARTPRAWGRGLNVLKWQLMNRGRARPDV